MQYLETDSYNSRIYVYESDVLYSFSIPTFYDKGFRYYVNFHWPIKKHLHIWLRFAQTIFNDRINNGSGLDEIASSKKSEIKLQFKYAL